MTVIFGNYEIAGTHESPSPGAPELQAVRTGFSGVLGESEIRQGHKGRSIAIHMWLHNHYGSATQLMEAIHIIQQLVGAHADLTITGNVPWTYPNCTFEGFTKDPGPEGGPLPDSTGLLDGGNPSWWACGWLVWRQLSILQA